MHVWRLGKRVCMGYMGDIDLLDELQRKPPLRKSSVLLVHASQCVSCIERPPPPCRLTGKQADNGQAHFCNTDLAGIRPI